MSIRLQIANVEGCGVGQRIHGRLSRGFSAVFITVASPLVLSRVSMELNSGSLSWLQYPAGVIGTRPIEAVDCASQLGSHRAELLSSN